MICGVLSCGSVRSRRCIVVLSTIPHGDNCFVLNLPNVCPLQLLLLNWLVRHVVVRHGNLISVRDVVLVTLCRTLCSANPLRLNDYVLLILLRT